MFYSLRNFLAVTITTELTFIDLFSMEKVKLVNLADVVGYLCHPK